ncbi:hypothetical protein HAX54_019039 [Datura stramonium]|uniref:Uncharacterized protein n=1 Tax=Datura stramonium TaxID=4076 RepID=A0ABS8S1K0_DATST|nr:hypothetical protein [Datura stramonium]
MSSSLQVVRDRRTGAVLFLRKSCPPFKSDPPLEFPVINLSIHEFPKLLSTIEKVSEKKKNLPPTDNNFLNSGFTSDYDEGVLFDFKNDYGIQLEAVQILDKYSSSYKELSDEVYKLSCQEGYHQ